MPGCVATHKWLMATSLALGAAVVISIVHHRRRRRLSLSSLSSPSSAHAALIGSTPLVELPRLSQRLHRRILVKMESMNPSGTGKDRAAQAMLDAAEARGDLPTERLDTTMDYTSRLSSDNPMDQALVEAMRHSKTGGLVVEGTSGSTGIALALLAASRGHACLVCLPDDQAQEKQDVLRTIHAVVHVVPTASIANPSHYVNIARRAAERAKEAGIAALFVDQFENLDNYNVHYQFTGLEILRQCPSVDAFCMSAGTGGTLAGVARYLKERRRHCYTVLVDPPGSSLYSKIEHGVAFTHQQREQSLRRHRYDTIAEGIGLDRMTANLAAGLEMIDAAILVGDQQALDMAHWLLEEEGLWVGSSSAMNVVGAVRTAMRLPAGSSVVTIVCDGGQRHRTRFWNADFCRQWGLEWPGDRSRSNTIIDKLIKLEQ